MGAEGSVAPKERVNIVYKPATGDAQAEIELPFRMLVIGDFTMSNIVTPLEKRRCVNIDKESFNEVLSAQNISIETSVRDLLGNDPDAMLNVKLAFRTMKDFEPDTIIDQIPELHKLLELREALKALKGPLGNVPDFRKKIKELVHDASRRDALLQELGIKP